VTTMHAIRHKEILPATWSAEIDAAARAHALEAYPAEAAGIVESGHYVRLENRSIDPKADVWLSDDDLLRVANADVFFHSHPDGIGGPSAQDMIYQMQLGIPFVILVLPFIDLFAFGDQLPRAPLIGRGFRHGVHDCYSLIRDWYAEQGVDLVEGPRDWEWWLKGQDLYLENFERAGFKAIPPSESTRAGDVLLFKFNHKVPMHGGLAQDGGLILHHPAGIAAVDPTRLSTLVPRTRYAHHISFALRHSHYAS